MNPLTGEKADLVCNLPNVDPGLQVFWSKDGMSFEPNSPRVQFAANGMKIEFSSVIPEDAGSYTCSVNDEVGTSYTTNVNVFPDSKCMYPSHYIYVLLLLKTFIKDFIYCNKISLYITFLLQKTFVDLSF